MSRRLEDYMGKIIKQITKLTEEQTQQLIDSGITQRQVINLCKKGIEFKKMLPVARKKAAENIAKSWLHTRLTDYWTNEFQHNKTIDFVTMEKNIKNLIVPKLKLPVLDNWELKDEKQVLDLVTPLVPSNNSMYQTSHSTGARQLTLPAKQLFVECQDYIRDEVLTQGWQPTYKTFVVADLYFYFPDSKMRDSHNMIKFLLDTMEGLVIDNDQYILPRVQCVRKDKLDPRIEIYFRIQVDE